jgi:hypothetical protein
MSKKAATSKKKTSTSQKKTSTSASKSNRIGGTEDVMAQTPIVITGGITMNPPFAVESGLELTEDRGNPKKLFTHRETPGQLVQVRVYIDPLKPILDLDLSPYPPDVMNVEIIYRS